MTASLPNSRAAKKRKARSPYQKYGKKPFPYHLSLKTWRTAIKEGRHRDADVARRAHDAFVATLRHSPALVEAVS